ncbi:MAG: pilus assembly PilX N-terminal domain-containing protein [Gammaproteobacteria bacterium]|jgi:type IV pilus assembly protein PilX
MNKLRMNTRSIQLQNGAVLVMALVMLTVMTLIGVSSMSSSTIEMKVSSNTQQHDIAFQAAQSIIDLAASPKSPLNTNNYQVFESDDTQPGYEQNLSYSGISGKSSATAITTWIGCKAQIGSSLEQGKAPVVNFFNVNATGTTVTGSATSVQMQGVRYPAAACPES